MRPSRLYSAAFGLAFLLACGGGSHSTPVATTTTTTTTAVPATGLSYTDPSATGWRLVKDAASTDTRLLLNLVGPSGLLSRGAGFNLKLPTGVKAGIFTDCVAGAAWEIGWPIKDLGVYKLAKDPWMGLGFNPDPVNHPGKNALEPPAMVGGVKGGNILTVAEFQKIHTFEARDSGVPLFQIALEFDASAKLNAGDGLPLSVLKSKYMADDIGQFDTPEGEARKADLVPMTISVGNLVAK